MLIICLSIVYLDRIYRIIRIIFAFPEERQKPISLFEGVHLAIKTEQRSGMNVQQQYHRPLWLFFPLASDPRLLQNHFLNLARIGGSHMQYSWIY